MIAVLLLAQSTLRISAELRPELCRYQVWRKDDDGKYTMTQSWDYIPYRAERFKDLNDAVGLPVIIYPSEEYVDRTQEIIGDSHLCLSFRGGPTGLKKTDWTILTGRFVIYRPLKERAMHEAMAWLALGMKDFVSGDCTYGIEL